MARQWKWPRSCWNLAQVEGITKQYDIRRCPSKSILPRMTSAGRKHELEVHGSAHQLRRSRKRRMHELHTVRWVQAATWLAAAAITMLAHSATCVLLPRFAPTRLDELEPQDGCQTTLSNLEPCGSWQQNCVNLHAGMVAGEK